MRYVEIINTLFVFITDFVREYVGVRRFVYFSPRLGFKKTND